MIALLLALFGQPAPMVEMVCDSYEYQGPTTIVCHGEGRPDVTLTDAFLEWADGTDGDGPTLAVAGHTEDLVEYRQSVTP